MSFDPGTRLGPYEILTPIGAGGMGEVYKARDTRLDRIVAIKTVNQKFTERFSREARAIAALNHPHICALYDIGPDYLVMEFVEGVPLKGPLPVADALRYASQIAQALEAAHAKGIVHRDLKPANILIAASGVKLLDFGLAKFEVQTAPAGDGTMTMGLTEPGLVVGTFAYMSPEQAQGLAVDARSDIFSFGAVLYEVLSGRRAFRADTQVATMAAVLHKEPEALQASPELVRIVARCLCKASSERFQTATDLRAALETAAAKSEDKQPSIAVLPFSNMSSDKENEYFSDGLAEEVINSLSHLPGLKVSGRTSAFSFKGKDIELAEIARRLGVEHILEGSVRRSGNRVRVTAQLVKAADGFQLWSERYDRELTDVFVIQDEISTAITTALKFKLSDGEAPGARKYTPKLPAYEAYLKGKHFHFIGTPESLARGRECFEQAIALDPQFPDAYFELAANGMLPGWMGLPRNREHETIGRHLTEKGVQLAPDHPFVGVMLGVYAMLEGDWPEAWRQYERTGPMETSGPEVRATKSCAVFLPFGRFREAIEAGERTMEQDPLNTYWRTCLSYACLTASQPERAIREANAALDLAPDFWWPRMWLAAALIDAGNMSQALVEAERAYQLMPVAPQAAGQFAALLVKAGRTAPVLNELGNLAPLGRAIYHSILEQTGFAAAAYEQAVQDRDPLAWFFVRAPRFAGIRESARWPSLARMMRLPETV